MAQPPHGDGWAGHKTFTRFFFTLRTSQLLLQQKKLQRNRPTWVLLAPHASQMCITYAKHAVGYRHTGRGSAELLVLVEGLCEGLKSGMSIDRLPRLFMYPVLHSGSCRRTHSNGSIPHDNADYRTTHQK